MIVEFDETALLKKLSGLTPAQRTVFAALCTERQVPLYREFHNRTHRGNPRLLEAAVDFMWSSLRDPHADKVTQQMTSLQPLELDTNDPDCDEWLEYASDAVSSVDATLQTMIDHDAEIATRPARAGYRIVDAHVLANVVDARGLDGVAIVDPGELKQIEREVLQNEVVQRELRQQVEDLAFASRFGDGTSEAVIAQERKKRLQTGMLSPR